MSYNVHRQYSVNLLVTLGTRHNYEINADSIVKALFVNHMLNREFLATYKRAHLLFSDLDRLSKIVNNPDYPVQFLFAGKAHPADGAGQGLIKKIYDISQRPEFMGKILFLDNYDMQLARRLVSGVDIWMNAPTRPLEASGAAKWL